MQAFIRITKKYVIDISMKFGINKAFSYSFYRAKLKKFIGYMQNVVQIYLKIIEIDEVFVI